MKQRFNKNKNIEEGLKREMDNALNNITRQKDIVIRELKEELSKTFKKDIKIKKLENEKAELEKESIRLKKEVSKIAKSKRDLKTKHNAFTGVIESINIDGKEYVVVQEEKLYEYIGKGDSNE